MIACRTECDIGRPNKGVMTFLDLLPRRNHKETTSFLLGGFDRLSHRHAFLLCEIRHLTFFRLNKLVFCQLRWNELLSSCKEAWRWLSLSKPPNYKGMLSSA
jgi:hypothetical protein